MVNFCAKMCFHAEDTSPFSLINCLAYKKNIQPPPIDLGSRDSSKHNYDGTTGLVNKTNSGHFIKKTE
jgi:hypothetical protein